jgi:uncharacterized protein YhbP (UPF0306 family)
MSNEQLAMRIIKENKFLSLATSDAAGNLWATPLSYCVDENLNFYFVTAMDSTHTEHILQNPNVAFSIFDSTRRVSDIDGIQAIGIVGQVEESRLARVCELYYAHVFPDATERAEWESPWRHFTENDFPIYRFFQIMPTDIFKRDTVNTDVDRHVKCDMNEMKKIV